jgi:hypothetical protein
MASVDPIYKKILANTTISTNTIWDDKIYIADNVIVTVDGSLLDLTNVDVVFGDNAGIDFINAATIRANNSVFRPCDMNHTWRGMAFYTNGTTMPLGIINECTYKNAKAAIEGFSNTGSLNLDLRINNNLFANCQNGVSLKNVNFLRSITGNTYMIDNRQLPFVQNSYLASTYTYNGVSAVNTTFNDIIAQNNFVFASSYNNSSINYPYYVSNPSAIILKNATNCVVSQNNITDFLYGINANQCTNLSVENNKLDLTQRYTANSGYYKLQVYITQSHTVFVNNNKIYSSNKLNTTDNTTPNSATTVGIICHSSDHVTIKQNEIIGGEYGICCSGANGFLSQYLYITENDIKKTWFYGIYTNSYKDLDITCNKVDMELNSTRDATGIAFFNSDLGGTTGFTNAYDVSIRNNCVLNSKNAIYTYNGNTAATVALPKVYNNFLYNYRVSGIENNGFSGVATTTPREVFHNTFASNNSLSSIFDVNTNQAVNLEANSGIQNTGGLVTMYQANSGASTASCAMQLNTQAYSLTNNNAAALCSFYFPGSGTTSWNTYSRVGKNSDLAVNDSISESQRFIKILDPIHVTNSKMVSMSEKMFDIYPVPAKDHVNIRYTIDKADNASIEILDLQGRIVKTVPVAYEYTDMNIGINELPSGIYILRMINASKAVYYSKMIKE